MGLKVTFFRGVRVLWLAGSLLAPLLSYAQRKFDQSKELGAILGTGYYIGDINPNRHFGGRYNVGFGGFFRYNIDSRLSVRGQYFQGTVEAWDEDSDLAWQQNRNLHFRNTIQEVSVLAEINYYDHKIGNPDDHFAAYLFTGLAFYSHMPEASLDDNWFALAPLGTEGQGTTWGPGHRTVQDFWVFFAHWVWVQGEHRSFCGVQFGVGDAEDVDGLSR